EAGGRATVIDVVARTRRVRAVDGAEHVDGDALVAVGVTGAGEAELPAWEAHFRVPLAHEEVRGYHARAGSLGERQRVALIVRVQVGGQDQVRAARDRLIQRDRGVRIVLDERVRHHDLAGGGGQPVVRPAQVLDRDPGPLGAGRLRAGGPRGQAPGADEGGERERADEGDANCQRRG